MQKPYKNSRETDPNILRYYILNQLLKNLVEKRRDALQLLQEEAAKIREKIHGTYEKYVIAAVVEKKGILPSYAHDDLLSAANLGFLDALDKYNPWHSTGAKFVTYALHRIKGSITDQTRNEMHNIDISRNINRIYKEIPRVEQEYKRLPTPKELCEWMERNWKKISMKTAIKAIDLYVIGKGLVRLDKKIGNMDKQEDEELTLVDTISDTIMPDPLAALLQKEEHERKQSYLEKVTKIISHVLSPQELRVVVEYGYEGKSFRKIGETLPRARYYKKAETAEDIDDIGVSESRVVQIFYSAYSKLKKKHIQKLLEEIRL